MTDNVKVPNNNNSQEATSTRDKPKNGGRSLRREFRTRESIITELVDNNPLAQAVYSFASAAVWFHIVVQILFNRQQLTDDISFVHWALFTNFHLFLLMWLEILTLFFLVYPVTKLYIKRHISGSTYSGSLFGLFVLSNILIHHPSLSWKHSLSNVGLFALILEQLRLILKSLAFAFNARDKVNNSDTSKDKEYSICSFTHFLYYHFAPVIVYRDFYPRSTARINWNRILGWSLHFLGSIYMLCVTFRHLVIPHFSRVGKEPFSMAEMGYSILTGYWTGIPIQFSMGYAMIHCWMNIWAELLHFGDKHFYHDWWTVTNSPDFLRKWNLIVGDFIFECSYLRLMAMTKNRYISGLAVYIISAIIHDYALYGLLGFFVPVHTIVYPVLALLGDISVLLMNKLGIFRNISRVHGNTLFYMSSYFSFSIWVGVSYMEFFARKNCPETLDGSWTEALGLSLKFPKCINMIS